MAEQDYPDFGAALDAAEANVNSTVDDSPSTPAPSTGGEDVPGDAAQSREATPSQDKSVGDTPTEKTPGEDARGKDKDNTPAKQDDATRRQFNNMMAQRRIERKREKERQYRERMASLEKDRKDFAEGEQPNEAMAQVRTDQIEELRRQRMEELRAEWEDEVYATFEPQDAEVFLDDCKRLADWVNSKEPELRQYMNRPYGKFLMKGWFDKVAKVPECADRWEQLTPFEKNQLLSKFYAELEKFGRDYASGKVKVGEQPQTSPAQPQTAQPQAAPQPRVQDVPVPSSGREGETETPTGNFAIELERAMKKYGMR